MLSRTLLQTIHRSQTLLRSQLVRNYGVTAVACQKADPIKELFLTKIKEYAKKAGTAEGGLVDATPEVQKALGDQISKIEGAYNPNKEDMNVFPTFTFADPDLEPVGVTVAEKAEVVEEEILSAAQEDDPNKPYFMP